VKVKLRKTTEREEDAIAFLLGYLGVVCLVLYFIR